MTFTAFVNRFLDRPHLNCVAITILAVAFIALILICLTPTGERTVFGTDLGYDYVAFYIAGRILLDYQSDRLYDLKLQDDLCRRQRPYWPPEKTMTFPYPPFFALVFWPLARLPYLHSYIAWLLISGSMYALGLFLLFRTIRPMPRSHLITCVLLAASFEPFLLECWLGGQTTSYGFFWMSLSIYLHQRHRCIGSGLALGMCLYKPPLLVIVLPFLLVARKGKILLGFLLCGLALTAISVYGLGWHACVDWFEALCGRLSTGDNMPAHKWIDVFAFCKLLIGGLDHTTRIALAALCGSWFVGFILLLKGLRLEDQRLRGLVIASIVTWTATINVYFSVYDSVVLVLAVFLTIDALCEHSANLTTEFRPALIVFLILIYAMPGISQGFAALAGFQPYTLILICFGCYQLLILREMAGSSKA